MKKAILSTLITMTLFGLTACTTQVANKVAALPPIQPGDYVTQQGSQLQLNGNVYHIAGTNNYYLHYKSNAEIDSVLNDAQKMGINTIRMWAFMDGEHHGYTLQSKPGVYISSSAKNAMERIDYVVAQAKKRGIRLVLVMVNNWGDFGGIPAYADWLGLKDRDAFFTNDKAKQTYKDYVKYLITHVNQYTNIANNQEPTIMTWELTNEARIQSDKSGNTLVKWTKEMSDYVRRLAPNQLIALGSEGFFTRKGDSDWTHNGNEGVDWERIIALPNINYGTFHLYPEHWGFKQKEQFGTKWIEEHAQAARKANKPAVLEEYGIGTAENENRDFIYEKWTNTVEKEKLAGSMFWILTGFDPNAADKLYPDYDGFRIVANNNRTAKVLTQHNQRLQGQLVDKQDKMYLTYPADGMKISDSQFTVKSYVFGYKSKPTEVTLKVAGTAQEYPMTDEDKDGYYETKLDNAAIGLGKKILVTTALLENGERVKDSATVELTKAVKGYKPTTQFDFSNGQLQGWKEGGVYQASFGNAPTIEISHDLGKPMLKVNLTLPGAKDWEELRVQNTEIKNFNENTRLTFDFYVPVTQDKGGFRNYAVLGDGWVKVGMGDNDTDVEKLEKVTLGGKAYYKQSAIVELGDLGAKRPDIYIAIVGNKYPIKGSVYLDNIQLLAPVY